MRWAELLLLMAHCMNDARLRDATRTLKALANDRRLWIVRELAREKELTVGDIAKRIKLSYKSTSKHLQKLSEAELLHREQRSLEVYCSIDRRNVILQALLPHLPS